MEGGIVCCVSRSNLRSYRQYARRSNQRNEISAQAALASVQSAHVLADCHFDMRVAWMEDHCRASTALGGGCGARVWGQSRVRLRQERSRGRSSSERTRVADEYIRGGFFPRR